MRTLTNRSGIFLTITAYHFVTLFRKTILEVESKNEQGAVMQT